IESTVLDLTEEAPKILRPGYYTKEMLEKYWEIVYIDLGLNDKNITPKSPGQKYKHYAPNAEVLVLIGDDDSFRKEVNKLLLENESKKIGLMVFDNDKKLYNNKDVIYMGEKEDLSYMGKILFDSLRKMDENGVELIIVRGVEEEGYGLSIMNRLKKAASQNVRRI
uniref:Sua5 family C-terminal domain-containing protein n=1 Tax=Helcococcus kunzii TaxID=40091 RepID=UPI0024ACC31E